MTTDTSRLVINYLSPFLHWIRSHSPNSALAENTRRAAEEMCTAAREEGRQQEQARCAAEIAEVMDESCENCRFRVDYRCHRRAPKPYNFLKYYELELLRDIAWSLRNIAEMPHPDATDDLNCEATESMKNATWPEIEPDEWCGEWEPSRRND